MLGSVRSYLVDDFLAVSAGRQTVGLKNYHYLWSLVSADGQFFGGRIWYQTSRPEELEPEVSYFRYPRWTTSYDADFPDGDLRYIWRFCGFGFYVRCPDDPNNGGWRVVIPHWSIALPLALFSAWLLLSKPRVVIAKTNSSPLKQTNLGF